jgi:chromosome segregation ATPase
MSDIVDLPLVILQKTQRAAEAAAASAKLLEPEVGHRLTSVEARFAGVEGRLTSIEGRLTSIEGRLTHLAAGQTGHELAIMRIADTQSEHTATLTDHTSRLGRIETAIGQVQTSLDAIAAKLP